VSDAGPESPMVVLARLEAKLDRLLMQTGPKRPADDEKVFKDPKEKYWQGESFAGCKLSECPAEYLRAYAKYKSACAWANRKEGDPSKAQYADKDERSAKLANTWAEFREASGTETSAPPAPKGKPAQESFDTSDDGGIPF
jgi:hypothetical protein